MSGNIATLETDRLILRRWSARDHAPFAWICADPDVMRYIGDGSTRTPEQSSALICAFEAQWNHEGFGLFAVEEKASGSLLGFTGLSIPSFLPEIMPAVEIGWRFGKGHWGHGFATEAARAVLALGTQTLNLTNIVSIYQLGNEASLRIMQRLGMQFDRETIDPNNGRRIAVYRLPTA